jgi:hypothetical protein
MELRTNTYPRHPEVPQYTSPLPTLYTSISYLCGTCVAVHLGQLELCRCTYSRGKAQVADDIAKGLSKVENQQV